MARSDEGMSTTTKVILAVLGVGGIFGLICCGGLVWWGKRTMDDFKQAFEQSIAEMEEVYVDEPQQVADLTASIVEIQIPSRYQPETGEDYTSTDMLRKQVNYASNDYLGRVVIREMLKGDVTTREEAARILADELKDEGSVYEFEPTSSSQRTFTIGGEECLFEFQAGNNPDTGVAIRQLLGAVPSGSGLAYIVTYDSAEHWDEEAIVAMIESIKPGRPVQETESPSTEETPDAGSGDAPTEGALELPHEPAVPTPGTPENTSGTPADDNPAPQSAGEVKEP